MIRFVSNLSKSPMCISFFEEFAKNGTGVGIDNV